MRLRRRSTDRSRQRPGDQKFCKLCLAASSSRPDVSSFQSPNTSSRANHTPNPAPTLVQNPTLLFPLLALLGLFPLLDRLSSLFRRSDERLFSLSSFGFGHDVLLRGNRKRRQPVSIPASSISPDAAEAGPRSPRKGQNQDSPLPPFSASPSSPCLSILRNTLHSPTANPTCSAVEAAGRACIPFSASSSSPGPLRDLPPRRRRRYWASWKPYPAGSGWKSLHRPSCLELGSCGRSFQRS
jgi:hypothetical protein